MSSTNKRHAIMSQHLGPDPKAKAKAKAGLGRDPATWTRRQRQTAAQASLRARRLDRLDDEPAKEPPT